MCFTPHPIPTEHVALPVALQHLVERLAENAHDVWAARRLAEGWTLGPERDDVRLLSPNLVAYADLPESERAYDRDAVQQTLKVVLALGYRIEA